MLDFSKRHSKVPVYIARPASVDPTKHKAIRSLGKTTSYPILSKVLFPIFNVAWPGMMSPTIQLEQALVKLAITGGEPVKGPGVENDGHLITNVGLRALVPPP